MSTAAKPSLDDVLAAVRQDLDRRRREKTMRQILVLAGRRKDYRDFGMAVRRPSSGPHSTGSGQALRWIGEVKKASPSAGLLKADYDAPGIARVYAKGGACAVSVLTETTYFQGSLDDLSNVRKEIPLPLLRKDFVLEEYQIVEAAAAGADAVLVIVAIAHYKSIERFLKVAADQNIACLVEVHTPDDLNKALDAGALIIGINNRNLKTLEVDLGVTQQLYSQVPKGMIVVSESGYQTREQIHKAQALGVDAVLIGETLMRSQDTEKSIADLFGAKP